VKKCAIVDIKGGLGNQLFTISFAQYLKNNDYKVFVDTSFYNSSHDYPRELYIDIEKFGFRKINFKSDKIFKLIKTRYDEVENLTNLDTKIFNRFKGYYQDTAFLDKEYLKDKLSLQNKKNEESVMVHLRRGDYIGLNEELKLEYYSTAIKKLEKKLGSREITIFTDDHSLKLEDFNNFNVTKLFNDKNEDVLETFKIMTQFQNFIISNSTFSFLAAFIGQEKSSTIYYPYPWMRNSNVQIKNIPKKWIQLTNY